MVVVERASYSAIAEAAVARSMAILRHCMNRVSVPYSVHITDLRATDQRQGPVYIRFLPILPLFACVLQDLRLALFFVICLAIPRYLAFYASRRIPCANTLKKRDTVGSFA